jgi:hypothetical protein
MNNVLFGFISFLLLSTAIAAGIKGILSIAAGIIDQSIIFPLITITCISVFSILLGYQR